jgi:hypothetical protein
LIRRIVRATPVLCICLVLIFCAPPISHVSGQIAPTINVRWYPYPVTPNDSVAIRANVTSAVGIRNVTIYYRLATIGLALHSISDYNRSLMQGPIPGDSRNGIWNYFFPRQRNGTLIYFAITAFDVDDLRSSYPDNFLLSGPQSILVNFPSKPYLAPIFLNINTLTISDVVQQANVSIQMGGYLPSVPELGYLSVDIISNGPYHLRWIPSFSLLERTDSRFFYQSQSSSIIDLNGSPSQVPYDTYTLSLNITIPYGFDNLTYALSLSGIYVLASSEIYNSWHIPQPTTVVYGLGNLTRLRIDTTLFRRIATYYPALVLMLVAFGVLGLVPLVSIYHHEKRYELFLNVIILASSAELSQSIFPAIGYLGDNIFLESFAAILVSAVVMMAISSLPPGVRNWSVHGLQLEFYTTIAITACTSLFIWSTNFPSMAKLLTPFAGLSGVILVVLYRFLASVRYRRQMKTIS